jgi:DNA-binding transcriptional LysR family regulator
VARAHPLARQDSVRFVATLPFDHVLLREGSTLQAFLAGIAQSKGHALKVRTQVQSFESLARMVEANVGIGVLPESAARRHARTMDIALVAIDEEWAVRQRFVVVRDRAALPAYTQRFIALICATGSAPDASGAPALASDAVGDGLSTSAAGPADARRRSSG